MSNRMPVSPRLPLPASPHLRVFVKFGGSFISPKRNKREVLLGSRIENAAREIRRALNYAAKHGIQLSLMIGHGAGRFGHAPAKHYQARKGYDKHFGWEPLPVIREAMLRMNLRFIEHCRRGGLFPLTVSPFAIAEGRAGKLSRMDTTAIRQLLKNGQIPLIHGDIILDSRQGFGIASTEELLARLAAEIRFDRVVMLTDVDGVHDADGATIPLITPKNIGRYLGSLGGSRGPDVTGGMADKVNNLLRLVESGRVKEARIMTSAPRSRDLFDAILGTGHAGTVMRIH
jgi:isopentenyl phosphate kinase